MVLPRWLAIVMVMFGYCSLPSSALQPFYRTPISHIKSTRKIDNDSSHPTTFCFLKTYQKSPPTKSSSSALAARLPTTVAAASALAISTASGVTSQRFIPSAGILVSLLAGGVCSNTGYAPSSHSLYGLCWTTFLPGSLALLLLSMKREEDPKNETFESSTEKQQDSIPHAIRRLALPFLIASVGSILGCLLSFLACYHFPNQWLHPVDAAPAAACLVASYVGGSVNMLITGNRVAPEKATTLLSSLAVADIVVMALYFVGLGGALQSKTMQGWFGDVPVTVEETTAIKEIKTQSVSPTKRPHGFISGLSLFWKKFQASSLAFSLALTVVKLSNTLEKHLERFIPGTSCAFIVLLVPALTRWIPSEQPLWQELQTAAAPLSEWLFLSLFASMGMSAHLGQAMSSGPACLWFSASALLVHILFTLAGTVWVKRCCPWLMAKNTTLNDVLVASNAAIGGAATAAAFGGRVPSESRRYQQALSIAGMVWGVVGYAVGTTIGVTMFRVLNRLFLRTF